MRAANVLNTQRDIGSRAQMRFATAGRLDMRAGEVAQFGGGFGVSAPKREGDVVAPRVRANRKRGTVRVVATLVMGMPLLAGCSNSAKRAQGATTSTTTASTTSTTVGASNGADDQKEIVDRYKAYWDARFEANQPPPNPDLLGLRDVAMGAQLDQVIAETRANLQHRIAIRHADHPNGFRTVKVRSTDGTIAEVQECVVDDDVTYNFDSGQIVNDAIATHNVSGTLRRVNGTWKVDGVRLVQRWDGVAGCAVAPQG